MIWMAAKKRNRGTAATGSSSMEPYDICAMLTYLRRYLKHF
jgi:hypothetical protein